MAIKLHITIPDINARLNQGYGCIRVYRGPSVDGPFTEITAETPGPAVATATIAGPYEVSGQQLQVAINGGPVQSAVITGLNPVTASTFGAAIKGMVSGDDGSGFLQLRTEGVGLDEVIEVIGTDATLQILGFAPNTKATGTTARVPMVQDTTFYAFTDYGGSDDDYYAVDYYNVVTGAASLLSDAFQGQRPEVVSKQQAEARSARGLTVLRGTSHIFREAFLNDDGTALTPLDASRYPNFQVLDVNGQVVTSGLATLDGTDGHYRVEFFAPKDAVLSRDDRRYRLEWGFIDDLNRQYEKVTEFDVRDVDVTSTQQRDQKYIAMCGRPFRVFIRETSRPYGLRLDIEDTAQNSLVGNVVFPATGASGEVVLDEIIDGDTFVYVYDVPSTVFTSPSATYQAIWTITPTPVSAQEFAFQVIEVPHPGALQHFASLRMAIDKFQKKRDQIQAYQDSDINEYLKQGLGILNGWHPLTSYGISTIPQPLIPYWLLCAQFWGLNAQHLLEVDLNFDFSGQTVTLNYDHTAGLEAGISRALDFLNDHLTPAKQALYRRSAGVGTVAGRPYRYSGLHNFVFPIGRYSSQDFLQLISTLGIL